MLSQADRNLFLNSLAARQRRTAWVGGALVGAVFSLGALATLQAVPEAGGHLPVKPSVHGVGNRVLSGVATAGFAADALPYAFLVGLPKAEAGQPKAIELAAEPVGMEAEEREAASGALQNASLVSPEAVLAVIDRWARAWRSKDVAGYLAAYGEDFQPADGISRDDWARLRRQRISDKREIQLELRDIEIQTEAADRVRVNFLQDYRADRLVERGAAKSLVLALEKDSWRILAEETVH
jgi:hypothetical protein